MIAFDSNILIYFLEDNPEFSDKSKSVFLEMEKVGGVCSALIITEVLRSNLRHISQLGPILSEKITIYPLSPEIAELAGNIRIDYGLKAPDSIHLATAIAASASTFITNDHKLLKKNVKGIKILGL